VVQNLNLSAIFKQDNVGLVKSNYFLTRISQHLFQLGDMRGFAPDSRLTSLFCSSFFYKLFVEIQTCLCVTNYENNAQVRNHNKPSFIIKFLSFNAPSLCDFPLNFGCSGDETALV